MAKQSRLEVVLALLNETSPEIEKVVADLQSAETGVDRLTGVSSRLEQAQFRAEEAAIQLSNAQAELATNTDPARQRELEGAVINSTVAFDDARGKVADLTQEYTDLQNATEEADDANADIGFSFTELNSAIGVAHQAYEAINAVYDQTVGKTLDLAGEVRNLSRTIGATSEQASMLIQAADDVGVSSETLTSALETAIRKGVRPTIGGIGELADEYNAIEDPIERTAFLQDKFGKSGADLAALMEKGSDGIKELGDSAKATGLVLSDQAVQSAREFEIAADDLSDSVEGLKVQMGVEFLPTLTLWVDEMNRAVDAQRTLQTATQEHLITTEEGTALYNAAVMGIEAEGISLAELDARIQADVAAHSAWADVIDRANDGLRDTSAAAEAAVVSADQMQGQLTILQAALSGPLRQAQEDYRTKTEEIAGKQADLNFQIGEATRLYGENSPKVAELKTQYGELDIQLAGVNRQHNESIANLTFAAAQSALFADGIQQGEVPALMAMGEQLGVVDQGTAELYKKFADLAEHNKAEGLPAWQGMLEMSGKTAFQLINGTTPAVKDYTSAEDKLTDAAKKADEQLGIVWNDLAGIKGIAEDAGRAIGKMNGALNEIPQHVGPYSASRAGPAAPGAAPPKFDEGGLAFGPESGYPAELHGTEAVVPLPDGKSIPVQIAGGGASSGGGPVIIQLNLDGHLIGALTLDGTLAELRARGAHISDF